MGQVQAPPVHVAGAGQVRPHTPQFLVSVEIEVHAPPQTSGDAVGQVQAPLVQVAPVAHLVVHVPHAPVSFDRFRQPMAAPQLT